VRAYRLPAVRLLVARRKGEAADRLVLNDGIPR
jgi:hypothetical protein